MMVLILFILILATFVSSTTMNILQIMEKHEADNPSFLSKVTAEQNPETEVFAICN